MRAIVPTLRQTTDAAWVALAIAKFLVQVAVLFATLARSQRRRTRFFATQTGVETVLQYALIASRLTVRSTILVFFWRQVWIFAQVFAFVQKLTATIVHAWLTRFKRTHGHFFFFFNAIENKKNTAHF
jgi:hypothetical protein